MAVLSGRFTDAFGYTFQLHKDQVRKANGTPYISHLLGVTSLVLENGGDEDEAIAALLHDAVEDQGGLPVLEEIRQRYGARVADIVDGCTDSYGKPKLDWVERKHSFLAKLALAGESVRLISLADKLHNARSLLDCLRKDGEAVWERFNGGKQGTLWYYQALVDLFSDDNRHEMAAELNRVVQELTKFNGETR